MRIIAHLDMDAFFAAVEERDRPRLKGLPIVVGSDPQEGKGRGVVSTANYKAREYGIRSATPITKAWQMSQEAKKQGKPEAVFLPPNFKKYSQVSGQVIAIIHKYSSLVEEASIDEAYFDLSESPLSKRGVGGLFPLLDKEGNKGRSEPHPNPLLGKEREAADECYENAIEICKKIKKEILEKEKLTCSIGIGPNKLIAKIASDKQKPDGLTIVKPEEAEAFLETLPIRKIPGIGPKTEILLNSKGIKIVKDLKRFPQKEMGKFLGKWGTELYDKARGIDDSPLVEEWEAKSIGEQETFFKDILDSNFIFERLKFLADGVFNRLKQSGFRCFKTIVITVRFSDFKTQTRSHTLKEETDSLDILIFEAIKLLMPFLDKRENPKHKKIRLIGVRIEKLDHE